MTAAEFWARVQPSGMTAEQELVLFWERMRDCPCAGHKTPMEFAPRPREKRRRDRDDEALLLILG